MLGREGRLEEEAEEGEGVSVGGWGVLEGPAGGTGDGRLVPWPCRSDRGVI